MFHVQYWSSPYSRTENGIGAYFVVTDVPTKWTSDTKWPEAARFTVSVRHDEATQSRRAYEYCDYLNKVTQVQPPIGHESCN